MGNFAELPPERDVLALEARAVDARRVAALEHGNFIATRKELDDPKSKASRGLTPGERFELTMKSQAEAKAKIAAALGDPEATRDALARFADALDLRGLVARSRFMPAMGSGADSLAHDSRIQAEDVVRRRYRERLADSTPDDLASEARRIARDAGHEPHQTDALARLHELDRHVRTQTGAQWTNAKAGVIAAFAGIESGWRARADLAASVERTAHALDAAHDLADAVRTGRREASSTTQARGIARELVAAGKS
jgi:hypothetical protein